VAVLETFERLDIRLHIVNLLGGAIDLSSPMGRFLIHILAAFAELERAFISERTKDGLARRKTRNVAHTCFPGYGFRWREVSLNGTRTKVREPDEDERGVMRSILQWRTQDNPLSWKEIADRLTYHLKLKTRDGGLWDQNRVRRAYRAELQLQLGEQRGDE
jgi:DNA invertase Pin-like site-specific DNA recombinase